MRRGIIVLITIAVVCAGGVAAWHFSKPARERHAFVRQCVTNKYTQQECSCTYDAYRELEPPYSVFVKSSVHDTRTEFAKNAGILVSHKLAYAGIGIDLAEINSAITKLGEDASVGKVLGVIGRFLARHKYKIAGHVIGGGVVLATYRTGRVGFEVVQVKHTLDKHCGGFTTTVTTLPGSAWVTIKDAAGWTWQKVKSAGTVVGIGRGP